MLPILSKEHFSCCGTQEVLEGGGIGGKEIAWGSLMRSEGKPWVRQAAWRGGGEPPMVGMQLLREAMTPGPSVKESTGWTSWWSLGTPLLHSPWAQSPHEPFISS